MITVKFFIERAPIKSANLCKSFSLCRGSMAVECAHSWGFWKLGSCSSTFYLVTLDESWTWVVFTCKIKGYKQVNYPISISSISRKDHRTITFLILKINHLNLTQVTKQFNCIDKTHYRKKLKISHKIPILSTHRQMYLWWSKKSVTILGNTFLISATRKGNKMLALIDLHLEYTSHKDQTFLGTLKNDVKLAFQFIEKEKNTMWTEWEKNLFYFFFKQKC